MDIAGLLYRIKENIRAVEGGDESASRLDEVRSDFLEMMELIKLFMIFERDSYYGFFLMNMQFRVDFRVNSIAGIKLNTFPPVFESNPLLLCRFTLKEILYVVCHEIDHVVLNHPAEMVKANPSGDQQTFYEFNLAADAAVNDRINHEIVSENHLFMSAPDGLITSTVLGKMYRIASIARMENYAYYFELIRKKGRKNDDGHAGENGAESIMRRQRQKDKDGSAGSGGGNGRQDREKDGTGATAGNGGEASNGETPEENSPQGNVVTAASCGGRLTDHDWQAGNDAEDAAAAVREFINTAVGTMSSESRGLMPGYFLSEVEKINRPPILSWQAILKKYVGTITANKRKTRTRLNRRQPERFDLSGAMDDKVLKIVVAIDTSGSVSDEMIGKIMNEIFAILAKRKNDVTIIECDSAVQRVYKARAAADVKKKVAGRGGTCFTPVIEYVNADRYYRDALLIYFTDGFGENEIPRPRTYRNMWVVFGGRHNLSVKEPYGAVLSL